MTTYRQHSDGYAVALNKKSGLGFQFVSWRPSTSLDVLDKPLARVALLTFQGAVYDRNSFEVHQRLLALMKEADLVPKSEAEYRIFISTGPGVFGPTRVNDLAIEIA